MTCVSLWAGELPPSLRVSDQSGDSRLRQPARLSKERLARAGPHDQIRDGDIQDASNLGQGSEAGNHESAFQLADVSAPEAALLDESIEGKFAFEAHFTNVRADAAREGVGITAVSLRLGAALRAHA